MRVIAVIALKKKNNAAVGGVLITQDVWCVGELGRLRLVCALRCFTCMYTSAPMYDTYTFRVYGLGFRVYMLYDSYTFASSGRWLHIAARHKLSNRYDTDSRHSHGLML